VSADEKPAVGRSNKMRAVTRQVIWARGAGRCYLCNADLIGDLATGAVDANVGFIAHIVADSPTGPRGDPARSHTLADDASNLMLLCHPHHKAVDVDQVDDFPEERLLEIKRLHEARVAVQTAIRLERSTSVLRYAANVGQHRVLMPYQDVAAALLPERYPAERAAIDLAMRGSALEDGERAFWEAEAVNLRRLFGTRVRERIDVGEVHHLSVFALAPQPLLVLLGTLIGDITPAEVFQRHREPPGWAWPTEGPVMDLTVTAPSTAGRNAIALKVALSATVDDSRIRAVLGEDATIWSLTTPEPHNDLLKRRTDLGQFRVVMRGLLDCIKAEHGADRPLHVFPAMPVATAVELGRVWMPKADVALNIWDERRALGGFREALQVEG
jgi:hypothetical protein